MCVEQSELVEYRSFGHTSFAVVINIPISFNFLQNTKSKIKKPSSCFNVMGLFPHLEKKEVDCSMEWKMMKPCMIVAILWNGSADDDTD